MSGPTLRQLFSSNLLELAVSAAASGRPAIVVVLVAVRGRARAAAERTASLWEKFYLADDTEHTNTVIILSNNGEKALISANDNVLRQLWRKVV